MGSDNEGAMERTTANKTEKRKERKREQRE